MQRGPLAPVHPRKLLRNLPRIAELLQQQALDLLLAASALPPRAHEIFHVRPQLTQHFAAALLRRNPRRGHDFVNQPVDNRHLTCSPARRSRRRSSAAIAFRTLARPFAPWWSAHSIYARG